MAFYKLKEPCKGFFRFTKNHRRPTAIASPCSTRHSREFSWYTRCQLACLRNLTPPAVNVHGVIVGLLIFQKSNIDVIASDNRFERFLSWPASSPTSSRQTFISTSLLPGWRRAHVCPSGRWPSSSACRVHPCERP
ncbi:protein of unknown function (plasmid) [Cupriavidus taiwanensis]|nr:protein of unknown function [Cupriavidus taiwanensis]SPD53794.1 protein of unknown function [Cupriavidus taiwanensis]